MALLVGAHQGDICDFGGLRVQSKINGTQTGWRNAIVHHTLAPRALGAPLHRHNNEDELSYVLLGRLGAMLGETVVTAEAGSWIFKPRGQWHTFWNAGNTPCETVEIISPAGFEDYFREVAADWGDRSKVVQINRKYALDMQLDGVPDLCKRFGLSFPQLVRA